MKNSEYLVELYHSWVERMAANPDKGIEDLRDLFEGWHPATLEPERVSYRSDMEHIGKTLDSNKDKDILISREILQVMSEMFLGQAGSPDNPLCNPLKTDFSNFPRLYINAGSSEALLDNAQRLKSVAEESGVDVSLSIVNDMQHVFPMMAGRSDEADNEIARITTWFKANF